MWSIAFSALSAFFGGGKNPLFWIAAVVLAAVAYFTFAPAVSTVAGWLGWETKATLKKDLEVAKHNVEVLKDTNEAKDTAIKISDGTLENTQKSFDDRRAGEAKTRQVITRVLEESKVHIAEIERQVIDPQIKHQQISLEHINAIWQTFCTFNDNAECANVPQLKEAA